MAPRSSRNLRMVGTLAIGLLLAAIGWSVLGGAGAAASLLFSFPIAAWRHDNQVGACFPLAIILVIVALILIVLLALLGSLWARHQ